MRTSGSHRTIERRRFFDVSRSLPYRVSISPWRAVEKKSWKSSSAISLPLPSALYIIYFWNILLSPSPPPPSALNTDLSLLLASVIVIIAISRIILQMKNIFSSEKETLLLPPQCSPLLLFRPSVSPLASLFFPFDRFGLFFFSLSPRTLRK